MGQIFVRASSRAKAYTRSTANHRLFQKTFKKGSHQKRAQKLVAKLDSKITGKTSYHRRLSLAARKQSVIRYLR